MTPEERWALLRRGWRLIKVERDALEFCTRVDGFYYAARSIVRKLRREKLVEENPQWPGCFRTTSRGYLVLCDDYWFINQGFKS